MTIERGNGGSLRRTSGRGRLYESIIDTIGDTPCVRVNRLAPDHVTIYVHPLRNGDKGGSFASIKLADGTTLGQSASGKKS